MSAIAGLIHFHHEPNFKEQSSKLIEYFRQFPIDDVQVWQHDQAFLSCHHQWITPESVGERLPYYDHEKSLVITADVILDNRDELFDMLDVKRSVRKNMTDSQLLLLSYSKWGEALPKYLLGDFAFMIWDDRRKKLFGARDFSGARTLYYVEDHHRFGFSTLIEPLFTLPNMNKNLNETWIAEFLAIPNTIEAVNMKHTVYESIMQVPPSHCITVDENETKLFHYERIGADEKLTLKSNEEYEEAFRDVFNKAVTDRLRTYGKVGSHLSGGLDSGSVVSFAAEALKKKNQQLHTFSSIPEKNFVDWTDPYYVPDERPYMKEVVQHVGNILPEYNRFEGQDPYTEIDHFLELMEMPYKFFENTFWLRGINETAHKKGVKVLLNGARGNHSISWGALSLNYDYYVSLLIKLKWTRLYNELDHYCQTYRTGKKVMIPFVTKRALSMMKNKYKGNKRSNEHLPILVNTRLAQKTNVFEKIKESGIVLGSEKVSNMNEYRKWHYESLFSWNKSGTAETKLSLRNALWNRDPTNDLRVIRFCLSIPEEQYTNYGYERSLLRRSMKHQLPDKVRLNHYKRGLQGADTVHRMRQNWHLFLRELKQMVTDPLVADWINGKVVHSAIIHLGEEPRQDVIFTNEFKMLTRALIMYRFVKNHVTKGGAV
ncbi:asparagine synthase-related protein [Evansella halocellulosilytica]|uniref:asparagine synthase-related protein n=1 Tax=Evansella halocellulosilytica TaxID=2011013 RepID=UPI000BB8B885|nr:asparagine synthase-related protein [Evansella halocellulosilytica]